MDEFAIRIESITEGSVVKANVSFYNTNPNIALMFNECKNKGDNLCLFYNTETDAINGWCHETWYAKKGYRVISVNDFKEFKAEIKTQEEKQMTRQEVISSTITEEEREILTKEMINLWFEYDYAYTPEAINKIIDEWAFNKAKLIQQFKRHENYIEGKFMIAFSTDYQRVIDTVAINKFINWLEHIIRDKEYYLNVPADSRDINHYLYDEMYQVLVSYTKENSFRNFTEPFLTSEMVDEIKKAFPYIRCNAGQKTCRVLNKICQHLGYDRHPEYNREYAKYADALSPITIKRHTILSVNPIDYLTMSFGNSWASCHTIDKSNKRNMPNSYEGMYSSGTISYMLDGSSIVMYTVDGDYNGNEFYTQPKINRNMFHYSFPYLVQGRMYPQDNDGCSQIYTEFRNIAQKVMSEIGNFPNLWKNEKGTEAASKAIVSEGTHYRDYNHFDNCNLSTIKGKENDPIKKFKVGHKPICITCGSEHSVNGNISCCTSQRECEECGELLDDDDIIWINGNSYCRECCNYCENCGEYHLGSEYHIEDRNEWVCEYCTTDSGNYFYCDECEEWYTTSQENYIDNEYICLCDECYYERYTECTECGERIERNQAFWHDECPYCEECFNALNSDEDEDEEEAV